MSVFLNKQNRPCSFRLLNDSTAYLYISTFDGLIIGRETGNPYYQMFAENYAQVLLPHSGLILQIPLIKIIFDDSPEVKIPFGRGVLPHYEVPLKMSEMVTDADPILEKALGLIASGVRISKEPDDHPSGLQENKPKTGYLVLFLIITGISIFAFMKWKIKNVPMCQ